VAAAEVVATVAAAEVVATAAAAAAAATAAAAAAEARTAAEAPPLTAGTNPFSNARARPDLPDVRFFLQAMFR